MSSTSRDTFRRDSSYSPYHPRNQPSLPRLQGQAPPQNPIDLNLATILRRIEANTIQTSPELAIFRAKCAFIKDTGLGMCAFTACFLVGMKENLKFSDEHRVIIQALIWSGFILGFFAGIGAAKSSYQSTGRTTPPRLYGFLEYCEAILGLGIVGVGLGVLLALFWETQIGYKTRCIIGGILSAFVGVWFLWQVIVWLVKKVKDE